MTVADVSTTLLTGSVIVYTLAMIAHAVEWSSARSSRPAAAPVLVAAAPSPDVRPDPAPVATGTGTGELTVELWGRIGVALLLVGFLVNLAAVTLRGVAASRAPWGNMLEFLSSAMVVIVGIHLLLVWRLGARWLGLLVAGVAAVGTGLAVTVFYVAVAPVVPALHSAWFIIHIAAATVAGAAFNIAAMSTVLYLVVARAERRQQVDGYLRRLPTAEGLDRIAYRFHAFAFPLWTFAVAAGAVWAEYAWGRFWGWDPKETWALVTWIVYACYLHARSTGGWQGRRAAALALLGVATFWFNFVGINLLVSGLHSYAGI
jgi:cytochrome c-type biogenesis protein CcsB